MPRMLDVQVSRVGTVSQVDVALGPEQLDLEEPRLDAAKAESLVRDGLTGQPAERGGTPNDVSGQVYDGADQPLKGD
ncbi:hypothetical protein [Streptomyces sp. NPDC005805]|uniref:hypothetical protein n=1 Tax=Streptomyces sp. NPDC005805 TaxID=3157068 RepID=UPI00340AB6E8